MVEEETDTVEAVVEVSRGVMIFQRLQVNKFIFKLVLVVVDRVETMTLVTMVVDHILGTQVLSTLTVVGEVVMELMDQTKPMAVVTAVLVAVDMPQLLKEDLAVQLAVKEVQTTLVATATKMVAVVEDVLDILLMDSKEETILTPQENTVQQVVVE